MYLQNRSAWCTEKIRSGLRHLPLPIKEHQRGISLSDGQLELKDYPDEGSGVDHWFRHVNTRLGSDMPGLQQGWTPVRRLGISIAGQLLNLLLKKFIKNGMRLLELDNTSWHKQSGQDNIEEACCLDSEYRCGAWNRKYTFKPNTSWAYRTVLLTGNPDQIGNWIFRLSPNQQALWTIGSGPVCVPANQPVLTLLLLVLILQWLPFNSWCLNLGHCLSYWQHSKSSDLELRIRVPKILP